MTKLDRCWKNCLRMWKWIAENWEPGEIVAEMKEQWLEKHHFTSLIKYNCFFCEWAETHGQPYISDTVYCCHCSATSVNTRFKCGNKTYHYRKNPKAFYAKLLEIDAKRTGKKKP